MIPLAIGLLRALKTAPLQSQRERTAVLITLSLWTSLSLENRSSRSATDNTQPYISVSRAHDNVSRGQKSLATRSQMGFWKGGRLRAVTGAGWGGSGAEGDMLRRDFGGGSGAGSERHTDLYKTRAFFVGHF